MIKMASLKIIVFLLLVLTFDLSFGTENPESDRFFFHQTSCAEFQNHQSMSRVIIICPNGNSLLCDTVTDGGGWTVFQRRHDGRLSFHRNWTEYESGFGYFESDFWLGLKRLRSLVAHGQWELRVDFEFENKAYYAQYSHFTIGDASTNYKLKVSGYSGNAEDMLLTHGNLEFSTHDRDNDKWPLSNCARYFRSGGWWYRECDTSTLNGQWASKDYRTGLYWGPITGYKNSVTSSEMKIRPLQGKDEKVKKQKEQKNDLDSEKPSVPQSSCEEFRNQNDKSLPSRVNITTPEGASLLCDTETNGGGWVVFQRRLDGRVEFHNRNWTEYETGFGSYGSSFWLGLERLSSLMEQGEWELRIDLGYNDKTYHAKYSHFYVAGAGSDYRLNVTGYSGNAGDFLAGWKQNENLMAFSTYDRDNDIWNMNCADQYGAGGWWYSNCGYSALNGKWGSNVKRNGAYWWSITGFRSSVTYSEMKIRLLQKKDERASQKEEDDHM